MLLSVSAILCKIASHPTLLQAPRGSEMTTNFPYIFATQAFSKDALAPIGGPIQSSRINDVIGQVQHSGKMKILDTLLTTFCVKMEKTLLFSYSTKTLSVIESYVKARGWRYCRLDGSTLAKSRQTMVDTFNNDSNILVFLISTKAGGVGLNLTSASKVILFDCNWNPAQDAQAQDRAYRMGQKEFVSVYRLIAQGTIEELAYMRQKYKQVLQTAVIGTKGDESEKEGGSSIARGNFEGIQGDSDARGELFGAENMLKFLDGSLLLQMREEYEVGKGDTSNNAGDDDEGGEEGTPSSGGSTSCKSNKDDHRNSKAASIGGGRGSGSGSSNSSSSPQRRRQRKNEDVSSKLVTLNEKSAIDLVKLFSKKERADATIEVTDVDTKNGSADTGGAKCDEDAMMVLNKKKCK